MVLNHENALSSKNLFRNILSSNANFFFKKIEVAVERGEGHALVEPETADSTNKKIKESILNSIGKRCLEDRSLAPAVLEDIDIRSADVIKIGISSEEKAKLVPKYPATVNCLDIDPPKLNVE